MPERKFKTFKIVDLKTNSLKTAQNSLPYRHDNEGINKKTGRLAAGDIFWYNHYSVDRKI